MNDMKFYNLRQQDSARKSKNHEKIVAKKSNTHTINNLELK